MSRANKLDAFKGEWALVTGASSGIGLEFARQLASHGWNLVMVSNQQAELNRCAAELKEAFGVKTVVSVVDLTDDDAVRRLMHVVKSARTTPRLLINNAGIFDFKAVESLTEKRITTYLDLHVRTVTLLCRQMGRYMAENGGGYILNMSSMACWMPMPGIAMYSATKAYIRAFSRALRIEMKGDGVSVTTACPGGIATDLFGLPKGLQRLGVRLGVLSTPEKFVKNALKRVFKGKAQYINGGFNRLSIVAVSLLPEWTRVKIKTRLLDRLSRAN
ncbi:MAG: SDR family NAD(P)-dependent oxidoreductase [Muribaculum sp.]|nr:SDR family NAD(P)-dependent oxidoreductase [Muribaculum sp.]